MGMLLSRARISLLMRQSSLQSTLTLTCDVGVMFMPSFRLGMLVFSLIWTVFLAYSQRTLSSNRGILITLSIHDWRWLFTLTSFNSDKLTCSSFYSGERRRKRFQESKVMSCSQRRISFPFWETQEKGSHSLKASTTSSRKTSIDSIANIKPRL